MECLKQCWSGRSRSNKPRTAKYNLQSLIEQGSDPERTNESVTGPYSATTAVLYRGDGPLDGTDTKWTLGLLPKDQMSAEAERYSWTIRAFEEDIKNLEGVEEGLKGPITTSSKLIRTLDPHVHKRFPRGCCMGFSRGAGDVYTEIGSPSHGLVEIMPWVTIMTKTDDIAALTTENRFPFHADQYNRILTGYEYAVPYSRRKCNSTSEADPVQESSILESLLQADEADPRNAQPPMLKVTLAGYQTSDDTREHDTYDFRFSLADDVTEGNQKTQPSADTDSITFNSFETKRQIEEHLKARSSQSQMVFTIIRPSAFFGNFYWPPYKLSMGTKWNPNQRFKHIATSDIGRAAAEILIAGSQEERFRNRIINLTGDDHTPDEIRKIFREVRNVSWEDPEKDVEVGTELKNALDTINVHPFQGTPEETRKLFPWVKDLPTWLDTEFHAGTFIGQLGKSESY